MKYGELYKSKTSYEDKAIDSASKTVPFAVVESYKAIRTNLMFLLSQTRSHTFEISSSLPGEGKSSCAVNLAIAFSQLGNKILLIDADLRKPSIYRKLRLQNVKGLSSVLVGFCDFEEAVVKVNDNFDVLVSGPTPPNPSELLGSVAMQDTLDKLSDVYEYIFLDSTPINIVTDAAVMTKMIDGVVVVVRQGRTDKETVAEAIKKLEIVDAKIIGFVLNGRLSDIKNNQYHRSSYYRYGKDSSYYRSGYYGSYGGNGYYKAPPSSAKKSSGDKYSESTTYSKSNNYYASSKRSSGKKKK